MHAQEPADPLDLLSGGARVLRRGRERFLAIHAVSVAIEDDRVLEIEAGDAGLQQIIYLGGLGDDFDTLSPHLRSRRQVEGLLGANPDPDEEEVRRALAGNLCRCTGFETIVQAVAVEAAARRRAAAPE